MGHSNPALAGAGHDQEITAAVRLLGTIQTEQERLRVFARQVNTLAAQETPLVAKLNSAIGANNAAVDAANAAIAAKNNAGAISAFNQAIRWQREMQADFPKLHQIQRQSIQLLQAEIAARGNTPVSIPTGGTAGGGAAQPSTPAPAPSQPDPDEMAAAVKTAELYRQVVDTREQIEVKHQENEALRQEVDLMTKAELAKHVKTFREGIRDIYTKQIVPRQERLTAIQEELKKLDPGSKEARDLRGEADFIKMRLEEVTRSLKNQQTVLDNTTRELDAGRAPIKQLDEAQKKAEAALRAASADLDDANKALKDSYQAAQEARKAGDQAALKAAIARTLQAYDAAVKAGDRYRLTQAELISMQAQILRGQGQAP